MKTYTIKQNLPCQAQIDRALQAAGSAPVVCVGLDMELHLAAAAIIIGGGQAIDLGKHSREALTSLVRHLREQRGVIVHVVQEACGFGWGFHRDLLEAGAQSMVAAPEALSGKRKTDRRDARALATALFDLAVRGNRRALRPVRVPGEDAQRRRSEGRHRGQLLTLRNQLAAFGRTLMWDHDFREVPDGWHGPRKWVKLRAALEQSGKEWLIGMIAPMQQQLAALEARIRELEGVIASHAAPMGLNGPGVKGLGEHTRLRLAAEIQDWHRFENRKQVGSFAGFAPSEHSSGGSQRMGSIDRMGNGRLRGMAVEAVWRLKIWNKGWRGFAKFPHVFGAGAKVGGALKKKAVTACARLLLIDLWRIETGRMQPGDVGLVTAAWANATKAA